DRGGAAGGGARDGGGAVRAARDHHLPAPGRGRGRRAVRAGRRGGVGATEGDRRGPARAQPVLGRRLLDRRSGGVAPGGEVDRTRRIVQRRIAGGTADGAARGVGVRGR